MMESTSSQAIDSDEGDRCLQVESYNEHELADDEPSTNGNLHIEPYVGMEFKSREDAREFYIAYGRHTEKIGFFHRRLSPREGCPAMLRVAIRDGPKWVITKFVKEHNHKLMSPSKVPCEDQERILSVSQAKLALVCQEDHKLSASCQDIVQANNLLKPKPKLGHNLSGTITPGLKDIEEHTDHLSRGVEDAVQKVRDLENEHPH
ncbi:Protein FAR1-related sequence 12 [Vitis vinifera]|uniref:Protein FAR1-related sequence 12 n=1 Tax=Vitis vinifera TaxID=29760 RepID=A0A438BS54_VITVI|nr:Protein FAR1-related sequence 12 [Vitis vinifera]